jgi:hypothetical protein
MVYNKQVNPYGIASSELGWRGFADGGRHGNPGALAPPKNTLLSDAALLGMSAALDGSGEWFGPSATGEKVGEKAMAGNKLARDALVDARDTGGFTAPAPSGINPLLGEEGSQASLLAEQNEGMFGTSLSDMLNEQDRNDDYSYDYSAADKAQLARDYAQLQAHQAKIAASKDYNKDIYHKGTFEFGDAPKGGVLFKDLDNKYTNKEVMSKTFDKPFWEDTYHQKYIDDGKSLFRDTKKKRSKDYNEAGSWFNRFKKD